MQSDVRTELADRDLLAASAPEVDPGTLVDESPEGVDRTLIRSMLQLSPRERLAMLQGFADFVQAARGGRDRT